MNRAECVKDNERGHKTSRPRANKVCLLPLKALKQMLRFALLCSASANDGERNDGRNGAQGLPKRRAAWSQ